MAAAPFLKISVITVCYNSAATIARTLQSVAAQSWPHIEHIVVDGASKDDTLAVIAAHGARVAKLVSEPDKGIYDAMNKGVALASGDAIIFLNADDLYADNGVLARMATAMAAEDLDALCGDVEFFRAADGRAVRRYNSANFSPARLGGGWMPAHPGLLLRQAVFDKAGPFRTDYRIAGDFEFIARAFGSGDLRYRHFAEVVVRMQMGGISTSGWRATVLLNREMMRACRDNGVATSWPRLLSRYPLKIWEFVRTRA